MNDIDIDYTEMQDRNEGADAEIEILNVSDSNFFYKQFIVL